ncbi:putative Kinesin heavy chain isoform 5C, partial [Cardiosporidium cionae]
MFKIVHYTLDFCSKMDEWLPHSRNVCVAVRFRPLSPAEYEVEGVNPLDPYAQSISSPSASLWTLNYQNIPSVIDKTKGHSYIYDYVFDETIPNEQVFNFLARDIVHGSVKGVNGTIFAYGQTSSGKTYTMLGNEDESEPGIIIRSVSEVFKLIHSAEESEFTVKLSFLEVYNEKLIDLMAMAQNPVAAASKDICIGETTHGSLEIRNLDVKCVTCPEEVFKVIKMGERVKHATGTVLNERSSRSHTILRLRIESK